VSGSSGHGALGLGEEVAPTRWPGKAAMAARQGGTTQPSEEAAGCTGHPYAPYIRRWCCATDEYSPHIFIGDMATLMNIWDVSKSNRTGPLFVSVPHIFVGLGTDEYNFKYIHRYRRMNRHFL
jgi:hypothetical protein